MGMDWETDRPESGFIDDPEETAPLPDPGEDDSPDDEPQEEPQTDPERESPSGAQDDQPKDDVEEEQQAYSDEELQDVSEDYDYTEEDDFDSLEDLPASFESHERAVRSRQKRERTVKLQKFTLTALVVILVLLAVVYAAGCLYFAGHFGFHTTLNGTDVSLQDEAGVEALLLDASEDYVLTIKGRATMMDTISAEEISLEPVFDGSIGTMISEQSCFAWPVTLFVQTALTSDSTATFDSEALSGIIKGLTFFDEDKVTEAENAYYTVGENGVEIVEETQGTEPDLAAFTEVITVALDGFVSEITLDDACYVNADITSGSEELVETVERLNTLLSSNEITLVFTEEVSEPMDAAQLLLCMVSSDGTAVANLTSEIQGEDTSDGEESGSDAGTASDAASDTQSCVLTTERGTSITLSGVLSSSFVFDESRILACVEMLANEVDTYGRDLEFTTTSGEEITVPGGNYGWLMDRESTASSLSQLLSEGGGGDLAVVWTQTAQVFGDDDIGDTYAEVDLDGQKVYLYSEGELVVETDCVSGLAVDSSRATPDGVFRITYRKSPATLTGEDYESYVTYWMPFYYGVGFHDATWRSSFGGEIYLTNGSHGCVNLPYSAAEEIYSYVYTGMPVIVYGGMSVEDAIEYTGYVPSTSSSSTATTSEEETAADETAAQAELEAQIIEMAEANYVATGMTEEEAAAQVQADLAEQLAAQQAAAAAEAQAAAQAAADTAAATDAAASAE